MNKKFMDAISLFNKNFVDIEEKQSLLLALQGELIKGINQPNKANKISKENELHKLNSEVKKKITKTINASSSHWDASKPMRDLNKAFEDRVVFLVFGKVNAGKSSFGNFLADTFPKDDVRYFHLENGKIIYSEDRFKEGSTETTARIQGVELGKSLVLLDSPGLESVTESNGELTKLYVDSADAVLLLTSSKAPGEIQELANLKVELKKRKPLIPVITQSDRTPEDEDEQGMVVKLPIIPKTPANRKLQEDDFSERAVKMLTENSIDCDLLRPPISISVKYYKDNQQNPSSPEEAGLDRLFKQLTEIVAEATVYKSQKANRQVINYLDEKVLAALHSEIIPEVENLKSTQAKQIKEMEKEKEKIRISILNDMMSELPDLIEKFKKEKDTKGLSKAIGESAQNKISSKLQEVLKKYVMEIGSAIFNLDSDLGQFEDVTISIEQVKGSGAKAATGVAGGAGGIYAGSLAGAAVGGPVGALVGGILGGMIGGWGGSSAGEYFVETYQVQETVGVSAEKVKVKVESSLKISVPKAVNQAIDQCIELIKPLEEYADALRAEVDKFERGLNKIKQELH